MEALGKGILSLDVLLEDRPQFLAPCLRPVAEATQGEKEVVFGAAAGERELDERLRLDALVGGRPSYMREQMGVAFPPGTAPAAALILRFTKTT